MSTNSLKAIVDRIEDGHAVICVDNGESLIWPVENLPADTNEGSVVYISLARSEVEDKDRENLAKDILNEIMGQE